MKLLHTSDWHLGHALYNFDRLEEQSQMIDQMVDIVRLRRPDVFLLCGDVFHTAQPSAAVQTLFAEGLLRIREAAPAMEVVVTSGNHDSAARHEIFRTPWRALGVRIIGTADPERLDDLIMELPGQGFVAAVPYVHERNLPEGFFQRLLDRVAARNQAGLPVVLSAHTTVGGCDFSGHDNASDLMVGGIDAYDLTDLGEGYDYLALGHIHRPQFVRAGGRSVRYCGTPLPVSFDECYPHSVSLVQLDRRTAPPRVEEIPIDNPRPLVTLPAEGWADWAEAKRLLADFPPEVPAYLRLNVEVEDFLPPEAHAEAAALAEGKQCCFCCVNARRRTRNAARFEGLSVQEFREERPADIARRYAEDSGLPFDDELLALFDEAARQVENDSAPR